MISLQILLLECSYIFYFLKLIHFENIDIPFLTLITSTSKFIVEKHLVNTIMNKASLTLEKQYESPISLFSKP